MSADELFGMLLSYCIKCIQFCTADFILNYYSLMLLILLSVAFGLIPEEDSYECR